MINLFKKKRKGKSQHISDYLFSFVKDVNYNFFDIGARNGSFLLPAEYTKNTILHAFEPNLKEFEKLKNESTDAFKSGIIEPKFKKKILYSTAVSEKKGKKDLFITSGAGAVSLMGPVNRVMTENIWRYHDKGLNYYTKHQRVNEISKVNCDKLDNIWKKNKYIDILKLDTEGSELNILKGAERNLKEKKILMIKSEFLFVPYYKQQNLLGHQQVFLNKMGYRLIHIDDNHYTYSWKKSRVKETYDKRFQYAGDAYFIPDPDLNNLNNQQFLRLGIICLALGFNSSGINFLAKTNFFTENKIYEFEKLSSKPSVIRYLVNYWKNIPKSIANFLKVGEFN